MKSEILAEVIRGETVESIHRGHLIILDGGGETLFKIGDPEIVTFFRSAAKALQFVPCLTSGAAEKFNFGEREIALGVRFAFGRKNAHDACRRNARKSRFERNGFKVRLASAVSRTDCSMR